LWGINVVSTEGFVRKQNVSEMTWEGDIKTILICEIPKLYYFCIQ